MLKNYSNIEDLIAKHLAVESSADEKVLLDNWLNESEANKKYFETLEKIFNESASAKNFKFVDTDAVWNKIKMRIQSSELRIESKVEHIKNLKPETRVTLSGVEARKLLLLIAAAFEFLH